MGIVARTRKNSEMTTTETTTTTIRVNAHELGQLLTAGMICAGKDSTLPMLSCVRLETRGKELLAVSTDRFRMGVARIGFVASEDTDASQFVALVPIDDVKRTISGLKTPVKERDTVVVTLTLGDGKIAWTREDGILSGVMRDESANLQFPRWQALMAPCANRATLAEQNAAYVGFMCTATYLADFAKAVWGRDQTMIVEPAESPGRPIIVRVGTHFLGLLMPVRKADYDTNDIRDDWMNILETS